MIPEGYKPLIGEVGFLLLKTPQNILDEIKLLVNAIQQDFTKATPHNYNLVGHIDKEYQINLNTKVTQYIEFASQQYCNENPDYINKIYKIFKTIPSLEYDGFAWINFQEKYEYNPIHNHDGVLSYVIWYQIPFYKENEIKYGAGKGKLKDKTNYNGDFQFLFPVGEQIITCPLNIDKTMEGYMVVFPSNLHHAVNPFYTSDDYRITLSGNIKIK